MKNKILNLLRKLKELVFPDYTAIANKKYASFLVDYQSRDINSLK